MKKIYKSLQIVCLSLFLISCDNQVFSSNTKNEDNKILLVYFSRNGENYNVGYVEKGNTEIIADFIKENINVDLTFKIERIEDYPSDYSACVNVARNEKENNLRPELKNYLTNDEFNNYNYVFLGYPIWFNTLQMPVYTFIELYDWNNKVVFPFSTNEGSNFGDTLNVLNSKLKGALITNEYSTRGRDASKKQNEIRTWVSNLRIGD